MVFRLVLGGLIPTFLVILFYCNEAVLLLIALISHLIDARRLAANRSFSLEHVKESVSTFLFL